MPIPCPEGDLLRQQHAEAAAAFDAALQALHARIGVSSRKEFLQLDQAAEKAWADVQRAHQALDMHIRTHGCEKT